MCSAGHVLGNRYHCDGTSTNLPTVIPDWEAAEELDAAAAYFERERPGYVPMGYESPNDLRP